MAAPVRLQAVVEEIRSHGRSTFTIVLRPTRHVPLFLPGQFAHFALDPYSPSEHWPESRVFSIASSPTKRDRLIFTYSVVGPFTRRMEQEVVEGGIYWLKLPYGSFTFPPANEGRSELVLIAGGTGITPFCSYLECLLDRPNATPIRLAYGAATPALLIYRELVQAVRGKHPDLRCQFIDEEDARGEMIGGLIRTDKVMEMVDHPLAANYYLSGPKAMIAALTLQLTASGVDQERIHIDAWE